MCDNARECAAAEGRGFGGRRDQSRAGASAKASAGAAAPAGGVAPKRALVDKLGFKAGMRVFVAAGVDPEVEAVARSSGADVTSGVATPAPGTQAAVLQVAEPAGLAGVPGVVGSLARDGMLWVLWPKGRDAVRQADVQRAGLDAGLVDVKVASVSESLSGLKFVFRLRDR